MTKTDTTDAELQKCSTCFTSRACLMIREKWYCVANCYKKAKRVYG